MTLYTSQRDRKFKVYRLILFNMDIYVPHIWAKNQNISVPKAEEVFDELEKESILRNICLNVYLKTEKAHEMNSKELSAVLTKIQNKRFDVEETTGEISGYLTQDTEFTTGGDLS